MSVHRYNKTLSENEMTFIYSQIQLLKKGNVRCLNDKMLMKHAVDVMNYTCGTPLRS